jgi:hypothetical protein
MRRPPTACKVLAALSSLGVSVAFSQPAFAAAPSVEQCLTASDDSLALETQGRLLATRSALEVCASSECPPEIHEECARRIELIQHRIPSAICDVRDGQGHLLPGARVTVDGGTAVNCSAGPLELEPGAHEFTARLPGVPAASRTVTLRAGDEPTRVSLVLEPAAPPSTSSSWPGSPQRTAALIVGSAAVVSLGVASIFALTAIDRKQDATAICPRDPCPSQDGAERWQDAFRAGNIATGFTVGGGVALAVAAGLWFTDSSSSLGVALRPGQVELKARF